MMTNDAVTKLLTGTKQPKGALCEAHYIGLQQILHVFCLLFFVDTDLPIRYITSNSNLGFDFMAVCKVMRPAWYSTSLL